MPAFEVIGDEELAEVAELFRDGGCLFRHSFDFMRKSGRFRVRELEKGLADWHRVPHCHAVSSGTAALFSVNRATGIGPGDEVITQAFTFVATVEAITECGATPVIANVDDTLNMDPADLERRITPRTKAIWVVHMLGAPGHLKRILEIGARHGIPVYEDACQSLGASYGGRACGTLGEAGTLSFDFGKMLTMGEGGAVLTSDPILYEQVRQYTDHGHEDNPALPRGEDTAAASGFNFRLSDLHAAVGLAQLRKFEGVLSATRRNHDALMSRVLDRVNVPLRTTPADAVANGEAFIMIFESGEQAAAVTASLRKHGVGFKLLPGAVKWHFAGQWDHIFGDRHEEVARDLAPSRELLSRSIAIPIMVKMSDEKIEATAQAIVAAVSQNR